MLGDIHLEMRNHSQFRFQQVAPYLALCGDIGNPYQTHYSAFIAEQALRFKHVFVIAGNHEYFMNGYLAAKQQMACVCGLHDNVHYLDRTSVLVEGNVRVFGCTLWSKEGNLNFNDYYIISYGNRQPTLQDTKHWHEEELAFSLNELALAREHNQVAVGISHHTPLYSMPSVGTHLIGDLAVLNGEASPLRLWCYGHDHISNFARRANSLFCSNQLGYHYSQNKRDTGFFPETVAVFDKTDPTAFWVLHGPPLP
eukprot:TRINITY_DN18891_c0_g1_i1.p1 TRINITY_DN18891_c0_g1~~TRINITY_DN18891_c0_g1_i1.p1  ORF type:complete len:295 (+),score=29.92 TRINITY_DN18891_c0_g1_i1:126-887(+)